MGKDTRALPLQARRQSAVVFELAGLILIIIIIIIIIMDKRHLFLAVSTGCVFLSGLLLLAPDAIAVNGASCSRVLERYGCGLRMPPPEDPERGRFVESYLLLCGIKLDI